ncbi:DUF2760 domain-containing protein [Desulfoferrobacter suflitae]|uniref:DUF2760 domain-containing protein n=1 Tax=Desulfoferrobacter suflitae TaxID=2865782 RepID=UPI002164C989|nr:DUF2760 domain-containing protein [Desulfoferrobacter suflitae]MCK8603890.1 DUF2760 domain-containing protein [Desulfoferrobacter suflitae]
MRAKRIWTLQSFLSCFIWNGVLIGLLFYMAAQILAGLHLWVEPYLGSGGENLPQELQNAFASMSEFLNQMQQYLAPALFGIGGVATVVLWLFVLLQGRGLANRVQTEVSAAHTREGAAQQVKSAESAPAAAVEPQYVQASPQAAVQMLAVLQREGRLIDFLEEDLSRYEDAQIGAAVRNIHQGCKQALAEYVELNPIFQEDEGSHVSVPAGFDAKAIRLTGNVVGDPPFSGTLRHRGWRIARVTLPQPTTEENKDWVLAPAEVEIEE